MKFSRGFTLVELLMGLAILSIVTTTVVPSFSQLLAEQRLRQVSNELRMSLTLARSEAIKRNQTVNVLPAESAWSDGWCVESDTAASCTNSSIGHKSHLSLKISTVFRRGGGAIQPIFRCNSYQSRESTQRGGILVFCRYLKMRSPRPTKISRVSRPTPWLF